jgi:hypothetical protein
MKSNFLASALIASTALVLFACAAKDGGGAPATAPAPAAPVPPGTMETSALKPTGSFQGPVTNQVGEIQAILTLDADDSNAQLTVSPNGATEVVRLNSDLRSFDATLDSVQISASWNGSAWVGQITNGTKSNSFTLAAGASTLAAVSVGAPTGTFDGLLTYKSSGGKRPVSLILNASTKLADAFASTLTSQVKLSGTLISNTSSKEALKNVIWDRETSTLSADGTVVTSLGISELRCKLSEVNAGDKDVLQCALSNSKGSATVASGPLSQKRVVVAPPYPVKPNPVVVAPPPPVATPAATPAPAATPTPVPAPIVFNTSERVFTGSGVFTNEHGEKQNRDLSLTITLNAAPTGVDQDAVVKFIIDGSRVGAKFTDALYNSTSGDLHASQMLTLGPIAGALKLQCAGVSFAVSRYDYYCHYESSVTNVTGEFHLQGASL